MRSSSCADFKRVALTACKSKSAGDAGNSDIVFLRRGLDVFFAVCGIDAASAAASTASSFLDFPRRVFALLPTRDFGDAVGVTLPLDPPPFSLLVSDAIVTVRFRTAGAAFATTAFIIAASVAKCSIKPCRCRNRHPRQTRLVYAEVRKMRFANEPTKA